MSNPPKPIAENPFRTLGVYANSPLRERTANASKLKAFLKVGRTLAFPPDFAAILPTPERTPESVAAAESALALPADRLRHAQFWFLLARPTDNAAFAHLRDGNAAGATEIWSKLAGVSAIQNRMLCALIQGNLRRALADADLLYGNDSRLVQWVETVAPDGVAGTDLHRLKSDFADTLCRDAGTESVLAALPQNSALRTRICEQASAPLVDEIYALVSAAKNERKRGPAEALAAGRRLIAQAGPLIAQLRGIAGENSAEYRAAADKLGNEVLQCAIDYFNNSDEPDAARKALELMKFAQATVAGTMARERCAENLRVMEKNLAALPPPAVFAEASAINAALRKFDALEETLADARALIAETQPHLRAICAKLGSADKFYLKISTQVAALALNNVISSVNAMQAELKDDLQVLLSFSVIEMTLRNAWEIIEMLDAFHMEPEFERKRYKPNRETLRQICRNFHVATSSRRAPARVSPQGSVPVTSPAPKSAETRTAAKKSGKKIDTSTGCIVLVAVAAVIFVLICALASRFDDRGSSSRSSYGNPYYSDTSYKNSSYGNSSYSGDSSSSGRNSYSSGSDSTRSRENSYSSGASAAGNSYSSSQKKTEPETEKSAGTSRSFYENPYYSGSSSSSRRNSYSSSSRRNSYSSSQQKSEPKKTAASAGKPAANANSARPLSGSKPYFSYYGETGGRNSLVIKTHGEDDFVVVARNQSSGKVINHDYIRGDDEGWLFLPDGVYDVYVYSGRDWDPEKTVGGVRGGFSKNGHFQKDEKLELRGEYCEYELFSDDGSPDTATACETFPPTSRTAGTPSTSSASAGTYSSRPSTGDTPYFSYYGIDTERGPNVLKFETSGSNDYVVIVKKRHAGTVVGHIYIRGGDTGSLKVPNGVYDVFFYSGRNWDSGKIVGRVRGGFATGDSLQKDAALSVYNENYTYTLYPILNGNLSLESASESDAF